jgi:hypothetical protein
MHSDFWAVCFLHLCDDGRLVPEKYFKALQEIDGKYRMTVHVEKDGKLLRAAPTNGPCC